VAKEGHRVDAAPGGPAATVHLEVKVRAVAAPAAAEGADPAAGGHAPPGLERAVHGVGVFRLHADHLASGRKVRRGDRATRDEAAAAHRLGCVVTAAATRARRYRYEDYYGWDEELEVAEASDRVEQLAGLAEPIV